LAGDGFPVPSAVEEILSAAGLTAEYRAIDEDTAFLGYEGGMSVFVGANYAEISLVRQSSLDDLRDVARSARLLLDHVSSLDDIHIQFAGVVELESERVARCFKLAIKPAFVVAALPGVHATAEGAILLAHASENDRWHDTISIETKSIVRDGGPKAQLRVAVHRDAPVTSQGGHMRTLAYSGLRSIATRTRQVAENIVEWCEQNAK